MPEPRTLSEASIRQDTECNPNRAVPILSSTLSTSPTKCKAPSRAWQSSSRYQDTKDWVMLGASAGTGARRNPMAGSSHNTLPSIFHGTLSKPKLAFNTGGKESRERQLGIWLLRHGQKTIRGGILERTSLKPPKRIWPVFRPTKHCPNPTSFNKLCHSKGGIIPISVRIQIRRYTHQRLSCIPSKAFSCSVFFLLLKFLCNAGLTSRSLT